MSAASSFDISAVRAKFPALSQDQVYLDNAGGSQTLGTVVDLICQYLTQNNVQLGATYRAGKLATARYNAGFAAAAKYINAGEDEIAFGSSTTQLFRNLSYALDFAEGDEVVVSSLDHEANIAPWVDMAARNKLVLKWWTPALTETDRHNPQLRPADLEGLLSPRTRLVACTHASNILGTITDVAAVAAAVHRVPGARLCVDGVAYAPHRPLDMAALGADFYCFSWYKVYGPHLSMLYASRAAQAAVRSLGHFFKQPAATLDAKLGLAGASYELLQAVPAVVDYLAAAPGMWEGVLAHEHALQAALLAYLNARPDRFTVVGETNAASDVRVPTVAFLVKGWSARDLVEAVEKDTNFGFRWGAFYSNRLVYELLGLESDGVVRISMVHYNTLDEVKGIIAAIDKVISERE